MNSEQVICFNAFPLNHSLSLSLSLPFILLLFSIFELISDKRRRQHHWRGSHSKEVIRNQYQRWVDTTTYELTDNRTVGVFRTEKILAKAPTLSTVFTDDVRLNGLITADNIKVTLILNQISLKYWVISFRRFVFNES